MSTVYPHVPPTEVWAQGGCCRRGLFWGRPWELAERWHGASSVHRPHDLTVPPPRGALGARELGRCSASGLGSRRCGGLAPGWTVSVQTPDSLSTLLGVLGPRQDPVGSHWRVSGGQEVQRSGRPWLRGQRQWLSPTGSGQPLVTNFLLLLPLSPGSQSLPAAGGLGASVVPVVPLNLLLPS